VPPTIGYLDLRTTTLEQVAVLLLEKLERPTGDLGEEVARANWEGDFVEYNGRQVASFWPTIIERAQRHSMYLVSRPLRRIRWGHEKGLWPRKRGVLDHAGIVPLCQINLTHRIAIGSSALPVVVKLSPANVSSNSCRRVKSQSGSWMARLMRTHLKTCCTVCSSQPSPIVVLLRAKREAGLGAAGI
jgi:hypothetical protein